MKINEAPVEGGPLTGSAIPGTSRNHSQGTNGIASTDSQYSEDSGAGEPHFQGGSPRLVSVDSGWGPALEPGELSRGKPGIDEVLDALDERVTRSSEQGTSFFCPLHEDEGRPSGWLKTETTAGDSDSYSVRCYACDGDNSKWFSDFIAWVRTGEGEGSWSSREATSTRSRSGSGSRRGIIRGRSFDRWYDYHDKNHAIVARKLRYVLTEWNPEYHRYANTVGKSFSWEKELPLSGSKAPLFRLPQVLDAIENGETIWVVEGEKDAMTMTGLGLCGTTGPNGANPWTEEQIRTLRHAHVVVVADNDGSGKGLEFARDLCWQLREVCESIELKIPPEEFKDVTDVHLDRGGVVEHLQDVPLYRPHKNPLTMDVQELKPCYLPDADGEYMLYPGEIHIIYGAPATYKSFLSLKLLWPSTRYLDFENGPIALKQRLTGMAVNPAHAGGFDFPETGEQVMERVQEYIHERPSVVVLDGFPGLCGVLGLDPDNNADVQSLFGKVLVPLKNAGICVVIIDHIPKDANRPDYPIGAQAKKAQAGVAYLLQRNTTTGGIDIFVAKDRHHAVASRCEAGPLPYYGSLWVNDNGMISIQVIPEKVASVNGKTFTARQGRFIEEIFDFIKDNPGSSKSAIEQGVQGKNAEKRKILDELVEGGHVERRQEGASQRHYIQEPLPLEWVSRNSDSTL